MYDQLGRTTTSPAGTVTGGASVTVGYFDNDMVQQQSQTVGGVTHTQAFTLDPSGHRILTQNDSVNGLSTNYYGDSGDSPAWTSTSSGFTRNIAGLAGLGAIQTHSNAAPSNADTVALQLTDLTGSVIATVDDVVGATPPAVYDYDPFGCTVGGAPAPARYGWLGKQQRAADDLGGLVLMGYRLYDPTTGRFLQTDPIEGGSSNAYDYAGQDPINRADLDGRMLGPIDVGGSGPSDLSAADIARKVRSMLGAPCTRRGSIASCQAVVSAGGMNTGAMGAFERLIFGPVHDVGSAYSRDKRFAGSATFGYGYYAFVAVSKKLGLYRITFTSPGGVAVTVDIQEFAPSQAKFPQAGASGRNRA